MAKALAKSGAKLCITSRSQGKLEAACKELKELGADCIWRICDITNEEQVAGAMKDCVDTFGKLDILIDNAAAGSIVKPVEELTMDEWQNVCNQNINGMFLVAREASKYMIPQRSGKMVLLASIASEVFNNTCDPGVYEPTKGAVRTLVKVLAANWAKYNINVNDIAPGYFMSDIIQDFFTKYPERYAASCELVPAKRYANPEELGAVAVLLSSDGASYMQGSIVTVDGGRTFM
jgi:gluconate 5-dehydrogenase